MGPARQSLSGLPGRWAVLKLGARVPIPAWAWAGSFASVTRTDDELSVIAEESTIPEGVEADRGWACLKVEGPFSFTAVGVLASVAGPLSDAGIPILGVSTFETDYLFVKASAWADAVDALRRAGHSVDGEGPS